MTNLSQNLLRGPMPANAPTRISGVDGGGIQLMKPRKKREAQPVDHDLEVWARLGEPAAEVEPDTVAARIEQANELLRTELFRGRPRNRSAFLH